MKASNTALVVNMANDRQSIADQLLIEQVLAGNPKAFEAIMRRYNQPLYRIARGITKDNDWASDILQEAYIKAYYALESFSGSGSLFSWLARIVSNEALMDIRKRAKLLSITVNENEVFEQQQTSSTQASPEINAENSQLRNMLETAIDELPGHFSVVFILRNIEHFSVREIAQALDLKEATVKTRYHRARKLLKKRLEHRFERAQLSVFEFAGHQCDHIVQLVRKRISESI